MLAPASPRAPTAGGPGRRCVTASLTGSGRPLRPCAWRTGANLSPLFGATATGEVWCSDDGGEQWTEVLSGLAPISKGNHYAAFVTA